MLGAYYRFRVQNECGETISAGDVDIAYRKKKIASDALSLASNATATTSGTVTDGSFATVGSAVDNTSDLYWAIEGTLSVDMSGGSSPSGAVILYLQRSSDNSTWPDDLYGQVIAQVNFDGTAEALVDDFAV